MATPLPLRRVRISALQQQCIFPRHPCRARERFTLPAIRAFSATRFAGGGTPEGMQRLYGQFSAGQIAKFDVQPAPRTIVDKLKRGGSEMAEDIGMLQNTVVRAPFSKLPSPLSRAFWKYFRTLIKTKATGLWSRGAYRRCIQKQGWTKYLPINIFNHAEVKDQAKSLYFQVYKEFSEGSTDRMKEICLGPVVKKFQARIDTRGQLKMDWKLKKWKSARVVSHCAAHLGADYPDSAYRQAVVRLESVQSLLISGDKFADMANEEADRERTYSKKKWAPRETRHIAKAPKASSEKRKPTSEFKHNGQDKTVVEYIVLQRRVISGSEEGWKVWGFTEESTPKSIEEDDEYFKKTINAHVDSGAF